MFKDIGITIRQLLAAITKLGSAAEKGASALDHLGTWADEAAGSFADEARMERAKKMAALNADFAAQQQAIAANVASTQLPAPAAQP